MDEEHLPLALSSSRWNLVKFLLAIYLDDGNLPQEIMEMVESFFPQGVSSIPLRCLLVHLIFSPPPMIAPASSSIFLPRFLALSFPFPFKQTSTRFLPPSQVVVLIFNSLPPLSSGAHCCFDFEGRPASFCLPRQLPSSQFVDDDKKLLLRNLHKKWSGCCCLVGQERGRGCVLCCVLSRFEGDDGDERELSCQTPG